MNPANAPTGDGEFEEWFNKRFNPDGKLSAIRIAGDKDFIREIFLAGRASAVPTIVLPEIAYTTSATDKDHDYCEGFNDALDKVRAMNPHAKFTVVNEVVNKEQVVNPVVDEDPAIQHHSSKQGYERVNHWIHAPKEEDK